MQKNKQSGKKKSAGAPDDPQDALIQKLAGLAAHLARHGGHAPATGVLKEQESDFQKIIRKCLYQGKDDVLYEAIERAQEDDGAYQRLKESIEEASGVIVSRRADGRDVEVNAFAIPLFAHATGGLHAEACFQDQEAFELLRKSIQEAQLESRDASVVLVSHAYHPDELDRITYSQLNAMVREALDSMSGKKTAATAIGRSMSGWPENHFAPEDQAVEMRFLLGFALKTLDDPFYRIPESEAAADRYFEARAQRFQRWTRQAAPLVKRCLVTDGRDIDIDFLYQDLFHGAKERGIAEYETLQMMSDLHHGLQVHGVPPEHASAVIGPAEIAGETVLRVNLYAKADGSLVASAEKAVGIGFDLQAEADDAYDALATIGVKSLALALEFDADGQPVDVRAYRN